MGQQQRSPSTMGTAVTKAEMLGHLICFPSAQPSTLLPMSEYIAWPDVLGSRSLESDYLVQVVGFGVWGLWFKVEGLGFRV